jgi:hypothetical protein
MEAVSGWAARVARWVLGVAVGVAIGLLARHFFIRPIPPEQTSPAGHFGEPCWACHTVTASVEAMEVE